MTDLGLHRPGPGRRGIVVAAVLSVTACGSNDSGDPPSVSGGETTFSVPSASLGAPQVWLVVMDDRADAADLQDRVASELEQYDMKVAAADPCAARHDPASFVSIDRSLVVVHPSASDDARYDSPATIPALRWAADDKTEDGRLSWVAAARQALTVQNPATGQFRALDAVSSAVSLLSGARTASTPEEQALVASLPATRQSGGLVVLDHEDESDLEPASYALAAVDPTDFVWETVIVPGGTACAAPPRLGAWATAQAASDPSFPTVQLWGCGDVSILSYPQIDCASSSPALTGHAIVFADDGSAVCRALVNLDPQAECHPERGWLDPLDAQGMSSPLFSTVDGQRVRQCEIAQLSGAALTSCSGDLSCADCTPGWCLTQVPELSAASTLHNVANQRLAPRFVLGANLPDGDSAFTVSCQTAP